MIASVDGCKGGWLLATCRDWPCGMPEFQVCPDFASVIKLTQKCGAVVVDMPIGLPDDDDPEERSCDTEARNMLKPGGTSRVFRTPPRQTLEATSYKEFNDLHRKLTDKGGTTQTWGIVPKLREVDAEMRPAFQKCVFEYHPEISWLHLAGRVLPSKHQATGIFQRIDLLESFVDISLLKKAPIPKEAKVDDVLDALVGLYTAHAILEGPDTSRRIPAGAPPCDERGLRMEMWF